VVEMTVVDAAAARCCYVVVEVMAVVVAVVWADHDALSMRFLSWQIE